MKVKFGAIVVDGRGKLGGHVASKNRGGSYFRTKVTPANPNTIAQIGARARVTQLSQSFPTLTASEIAGWNSAVGDYAKTDIFGDIKNPSGINLYIKLNSNLLEISEPVIAAAPQKVPVDAMEIAGLNATAGIPAFDVQLVDVAVPAAHKAIVRASAQLSPGIANFKGKMRNVEIFASATAPNTFDILASYTAKFGNLVAGKKINVEVVLVSTVTGQKGAVYSFSTLVAV